MYLVKSKNLEINKKTAEIEKKNIGNYYSNDRFYTLLNGYLNVNLKHKSKIIAFIVDYLFKSGNYKHDPSIANGKSWGVKIIDWFCILCIIGFFAMIISVIGVSLNSVPTDVKGFAKFAEGFINSLSGNIVMLVFAVIFFVVSILWIVMYFTIRKKNKKLSLKDYVTKKIEFILKYSLIVKTAGKTKSKIVVDKKFEVHYLKKFESQGGNADRWLNLQLINLLASIFNDFSLVFVFDELSDDEYKEMQKIIDCDFKKIDIVKL